MKALTVYCPRRESVVVLNYDRWAESGEIMETDIRLPFSMELQEVTLTGSRRVIGLPREQAFRIEARQQGYKVLSNTPD